MSCVLTAGVGNRIQAGLARSLPGIFFWTKRYSLERHRSYLSVVEKICVQQKGKQREREKRYRHENGNEIRTLFEALIQHEGTSGPVVGTPEFLCVYMIKFHGLPQIF